jgi:hypothetical protein
VARGSFKYLQISAEKEARTIPSLPFYIQLMLKLLKIRKIFDRGKGGENEKAH